MAARHTFEHKKLFTRAPRVPVISSFFRRGGGDCVQICINPGSLRRRRQGTSFVASAQAVDFTRQVTPRYTRDTQTLGWEKQAPRGAYEARVELCERLPHFFVSAAWPSLLGDSDE